MKNIRDSINELEPYLEKRKNMNVNNAKCLIAYFSRPGNNYVGGTIVNLPVGNTEVVAKMIREMTGGDLFHIEAVKQYPKDYTETTDVAKEELRTHARPNYRPGGKHGVL